jgi:hypothetical protein
MKTKIQLYSFIFVNLFCFSALANFQQTAVLDSEKFIGKIGQYSEIQDGTLSSNNTPCVLVRTIKATEHYAPEDAKDFSSFSINLGDGSRSETIPAIIYYIFSSGKYKSTTGPEGTASRNVLDDNSVIYSNPTASYEGFASCGPWGHVGKPMYGIQEQFILGPDYVQYSINFRCKLLGGEEHQLIKTCKF